MARLLALEWDSQEVRVAVASQRGSEVVLERAFAVVLPGRPSEGEGGESGSGAADQSPIGSALAEALAAHGISSGEALVALGRTNIELRGLSLPPAPPEERPDLVRFQAMQAFTTIGDDWPLDFVELKSGADATSVLAAAIAPGVVDEVREVCAAASLTPQQLVLRAFAAASLLRGSRTPDDERCRVVVDLLAQEADLSVLADGQVVLMRTVRLPGQGGESVRNRALLGELRRTIGAGQNQLRGQRIEQVVLLGDEQEHAELESSLRSALSLDVVSFNPLQHVTLARGLRSNLPANPGRYASLVGMLSDAAHGNRPAVDFLNPRKRPEPPSQWRRYALIGAAAAVLLLVANFMFWAKVHRLNQEVALLEKRQADLAPVLERDEQLLEKIEAIHEFTDGDITWLDELWKMARQLPSAEQAILDEVVLQAHTDPGGAILLKGHVNEASMIATFEDSLRYNENVVAGRHGLIDRARTDYMWLLDTTVIVSPDVQQGGRSLGRPFRDDMQQTMASLTEQPGTGSSAEPAATERDDDTEADEPSADPAPAEQTAPPANGPEPTGEPVSAPVEETDPPPPATQPAEQTAPPANGPEPTGEPVSAPAEETQPQPPATQPATPPTADSPATESAESTPS